MSNNTEWSKSFWNRAVAEYNSQDESHDENLTQREVLSQMIGHVLVDAGILEDFEPLYLERNNCIIDGYFFEEEGEDNSFLTLKYLEILFVFYHLHERYHALQMLTYKNSFFQHLAFAYTYAEPL